MGRGHVVRRNPLHRGSLTTVFSESSLPLVPQLSPKIMFPWGYLFSLASLSPLGYLGPFMIRLNLTCTARIPRDPDFIVGSERIEKEARFNHRVQKSAKSLGMPFPVT